MVSDDQVMHCGVFATLLDAAGIPLPEMNGQNRSRNVSASSFEIRWQASRSERSMIFELWGNIGLRKGDYKLWAGVGREFTPDDWSALVNKLKNSDLALFDLGKRPFRKQGSQGTASRGLRHPQAGTDRPLRLASTPSTLRRKLIRRLFAPKKKGSETTKHQATEHPGFLIIVVDDMGYGDLSKYEHSAMDAHTPNLDELASQGTLYTPSLCFGSCLQSVPGRMDHRSAPGRWDPKKWV